MLSETKSHQEVEVQDSAAAPGGTVEFDLTPCYDLLYRQIEPECLETDAPAVDNPAADAIMRYYGG